jgi:low affinity Fe/Cu permease
MKERFDRAAATATHALGSPTALLAALVVIIVWAFTGPLFGFSDTWQLVINTGTTIVTFLMVFVIQNAQNRDSKALHAKLDELIRSIDAARNEFVDAENEPEEVLDRQIAEIRAWAAQASPHSRQKLAARLTEVPGIRGVSVDDETARSASRDASLTDGPAPSAGGAS